MSKKFAALFGVEQVDIDYMNQTQNPGQLPGRFALLQAAERGHLGVTFHSW